MENNFNGEHANGELFKWRTLHYRRFENEPVDEKRRNQDYQFFLAPY